MQIVVGSSSLKIVALTTRAHFYINPGKNITNQCTWFSVLTNLKENVEIDLLEKVTYLEYVYTVFIPCLTVLDLKSPVTGLIDY